MRFVHIFSPAIRVLSGLGLVLLIPVLTGCSPAIGKVSGKVTYKGQPVPGGLITFRPADPAKNSITVELDTEGRYSATLPAGDVTVIIDNRELEPRPSMPSMPAGIPLSAEAQAKLRGKAPRGHRHDGRGAEDGRGRSATKWEVRADPAEVLRTRDVRAQIHDQGRRPAARHRADGLTARGRAGWRHRRPAHTSLHYRGVRRAFVLDDRNQRLPCAGGGGGGVMGGVPANTVLESVLLAMESSGVVVVSRAVGVNVPANPARRTISIVSVAPPARSPTVHFRVVLSKSVELEETNVKPPKFTVTSTPAANTDPRLRAVNVIVTSPPG